MRRFWKIAPMKVAAMMLALGAVATLPACAQTTYGGGLYYGDTYPGGYYGADAYGYCDAYYGCPDDYWNLPVYYGSVYFDGAWLGGPLYYRDWGGQRQYWIHGGWHYDGWRGTRPSRYRAWHTGPALGLSWYRSHRAFRQGVRANANRNSYSQTQRYGYDGHGNSNRYGNGNNNNNSNNGNRYGYGGHTISRPENRYRNSFTGQANRGEFRRPSPDSGQNSGTSTPWRGNRMGHPGGGQGGNHQSGNHQGGSHQNGGGQDGRRHR